LNVRRIVRGAFGAALVIGLSAWVAPLAAGAQTVDDGIHATRDADHVVFVQTDNTAGNQVVAYDRSQPGLLTLAGTYDTGGLGGALNGSAVDHLASQGSLTYDNADDLLFAVNAGSNTLSVFSVHGDHLFLRQVIGSGGLFPVSVAARGDLVYVLNARSGASLSGYRIVTGELHPINGSVRSLGLTIPTDTNEFTHTPGQVAFSPNGSQLIVTTKASANTIDVFAVRRDGRLDPTLVANADPGAVPFGVAFDRGGNLLVANAGPNSVSTFNLHPDGTVTLIDSVANGQAATCWIARAGRYFYASNAGSPSLSGYKDNPSGDLTLLGSTPTDPGTVDASASTDGHFLYVQTGAKGIVDEFEVGPHGSLTQIGSVTVAGAAGGEGIVAS
jgi:6-phosphogluconolactonase (cycloisomerase 2 family)